MNHILINLERTLGTIDRNIIGCFAEDVALHSCKLKNKGTISLRMDES